MGTTSRHKPPIGTQRTRFYGTTNPSDCRIHGASIVDATKDGKICKRNERGEGLPRNNQDVASPKILPCEQSSEDILHMSISLSGLEGEQTCLRNPERSEHREFSDQGAHRSTEFAQGCLTDPVT